MGDKIRVAALVVIVTAYLGLVAYSFAGCGGGNKSPDSSDRSTSIRCEHDGAVYICSGAAPCVEQPAQEVADVDSTARVAAVKDLTTGDITIVAECGSSVNLPMDGHETVTTTNTNANLGLNSGTGAQ